MDGPDIAKARRLATVGAVARPVQHEINNLLTVVLANLDLLRRHAAEGAPRRQLDRIGEATRRLEATTRAVLALARRPVPDSAPFAPALAVAAIRPLLTVLMPTPDALSAPVPAEGAAMVRADRAVFEDALLACVGALSGGGRLEIGFVETADAVEMRLGFGAAPPAAVLAALAPLGAEADGADGMLVRLARDQPEAA